MRTRKMHMSLFGIICQVLLSCSLQTILTHVTWELETNVIRFGETVVLICTVHEVEVIDTRETRQWYQGPNLVCYNGKPTNPLKYMESLYKNKFKLLIYNVTEADLNCDYKCLYSFDVYSRTLNITEENFEFPPTENTTELGYSYTTDGNLSVKLHMKKVVPVPSCTIEFEDFQLIFEDIMYTRKGLYYEVHLVHESHIVVNESTQFNVTCQLLQEYLIGTRIIGVPTGGTNVDVADENSTNNDYIFVLVALSLVITAVVVVVCYKVKRRKNTPNAEVYYSQAEPYIKSNTSELDSLTLEIHEEEQLPEDTCIDSRQTPE